MSIELKPCPFCGGEAGIVEAEFWGGGVYYMRLGCNDCAAEMGGTEAIARWNTRAERRSSTVPRRRSMFDGTLLLDWAVRALGALLVLELAELLAFLVRSSRLW